MKWAVSGTRPPRDGFSETERRFMHGILLNSLSAGDEFGCGGCVGVDAELFLAVHTHNALLPRPIRLVLWLPGDKRQVATSLLPLADDIYDDHYGLLHRDQLLVNWCARLLAFPLHEEQAQPRSGTWATVRMARRAAKLEHAFVLRPNVTRT